MITAAICLAVSILVLAAALTFAALDKSWFE